MADLLTTLNLSAIIHSCETPQKETATFAR
jgi:hypothetical protein